MGAGTLGEEISDDGGERRSATIADRIREGQATIEASRRSVARRPPFVPHRDYFADDELPEIGRGELTVERVSSGVLHHGAILVRGLLARRDVEELRRFLDLGPMRIADATGNPNQARMVDALVEVYAEAGILALAEAHVGEYPVGMVSRTGVKRERSPAGIAWHQDAGFWGDGLRALNVWTALTPCGDQCPGLSVIPRRLETVLEPGYQIARAPSNEMLSAVDALIHDVDVAEPRLEPGDAILFDEMTLHRTSPRPWNVPSRDVAVTWLFAPSRFPKGFHAPLAL